jgi:carboxyl-terminal processing protease
LIITVKKPNGVIATVPLIKEVISVEENSISGYLLKGKKTIGYIALPGFYSQWDTWNPLGCANDVAKEILKLQKENIEGLILDLRFNGGGSLHEAMGLMGLFIDEGPLFLIRDKNNKIALKKDLNRGALYNGPLVLMVNGLSASASEVLTAGLRDYNRALVVGNNTFGKATAQENFPLETNPGATNIPFSANSDASLNITTSKIYRINGISYQSTGVAPDIELPDVFSNLDLGEAVKPYSLKPDTISKKVVYNPLPELPVKELAEKSRDRIEKSPSFARIKSLADSVHHSRTKNESRSLQIEKFGNYELQVQKITDKILFKPSDQYTVQSCQYNNAVLLADDHRKKLSDGLLNNILEDFYIEETYLILTDLLTLKKTNP